MRSSLSRIDNCVSAIAENGTQAIEMIQAHDYDLVLMDIGLPDIEGIEVTRQIRAMKNPVTSQVPIVALTGHVNDLKKREEAFAAGMQDVFSKPLSLHKLEALLEQYVFTTKQKSGFLEQEQQRIKACCEVIDWKANVFNLNGDEDGAT